MSFRPNILHYTSSRIVGDIRYQIQQHCYEHSLEQRIGKIPPQGIQTLHSIEWKGLEAVFNRLNPSKKIARMKLVHQLLPTKSLMCQRKHENTSRCLRCSQAAETFLHVFQCQYVQNKATHLTTLSTL